jgi:hypothetical protein
MKRRKNRLNLNLYIGVVKRHNHAQAVVKEINYYNNEG